MAGGRILIIDDSASIVQHIREILEADHELITADSGEGGLEIIDGFRPDLVLLDVMMGGMDGYATCRRIRRRPGLGFVKIIMISSHTGLEERLKGYDAGADDYLGKPFRPEELQAKVRVFLRLKAAEDELQALNDQLNEQVRIRSEQLIQSEKLAAVGRYAAGIVHNLNNPLQAIMGNAELLAMRQPDDRQIMSLRKAAAQMKRIIGSILSTGDLADAPGVTTVDINEVITHQLEFFKAHRFFKHKVEARLDLAPLPPYPGVAIHFSQCMGNLIKNAIEAMYDEPPRVLSIQTARMDKAILIRVADTGHGISEDQLDRIFHPFFTTKPLTADDGRPTGTGLGLAYTREMIESYGGVIRVDPAAERGTVFSVRLPLPVG
jgi:two-component system, sensor histidine kinase and response regulator